MSEEKKIISRKEAKELGLIRYFTGKKCKRGHIDERWTSGAKCVSCHYEDNPPKGFYGISEEEKKRKSKERARRWYEKNKKLTIERAAKWKKENPEKVSEYYKKYDEELFSTPQGKTIRLMRDSIRRCMINKNERSSHILGYTKHDLISHLEELFSVGMTWDNHGEWHIDHIIPVSWFVKAGVNDPKVINKLSNLRPLWAAENNSRWRPRG